MESVHKGNWVWPVLPLIESDFEILWPSLCAERIVDILVIFYGVSQQGKTACWATTFGCVCPYVPSTNRTAWFFDDQYPRKESIEILVLFAWNCSWREGSIWDYCFWLGLARCTSCPLKIAGFFVQQGLWKESIDILVFLHEVCHQGKVTYETIIFGWMTRYDSCPIRFQDSDH